MANRIIFLDADTVDLGDADLTALKHLGAYRGFGTTTAAQVRQRIQSADIVITNKVILDAALLRGLSQLKLICVAATGYNNIDVQTAQRHSIAVSNVSGYSTTSVAEHTLLFLLALSHRLLEHNLGARQNWWQTKRFAGLDWPYANLSGKTLGIIGYGTIGQNVAKLARAFNMRVLVAKLPGRRYAKLAQRVALPTLLQQSDFVSLHCALSPQTQHLINAQTLKHLRPHACLLNLARGPIVDETALIHALRHKQLRAYATDVLSQEPPPRKHPLFAPALRDRVLLSPHVAWASVESRQNLINELAKNIQAFRQGKKRNRIV